MYGDTQNTGATRSQCSLNNFTFRITYKAMTHFCQTYVSHFPTEKLSGGKTQVCALANVHIELHACKSELQVHILNELCQHTVFLTNYFEKILNMINK